MKIILAGLCSGILVLCFFPFDNPKNKDPMKGLQTNNSETISIFLCGDVMTGRGIDQILPHSVDPVIYEPYVKDAGTYVELAERKNGSIPAPVDYSYIWGDATKVWKEYPKAIKIINLETSITDHDDPWPGKGINYRMHPENTTILTEAGIDYCALANNHTMDWGRKGLLESLQSLSQAGILHSGAGKNIAEARKPAILKSDYARFIIYSYGSRSSGIPESWAASSSEPGINLLQGLTDEMVRMIQQQLSGEKKKNDIVIFSIHWGGNWGYQIPHNHREMARRLIDEAGVDIIHGHSSHHPMGIEVYNERLILYGAGDFINDYEGIEGYEHFRDDLTLMYFPTLEPGSGKLISMTLIPMQIKKFRLHHAQSGDAEWLKSMLNREGKKLGTHFTVTKDQKILMRWD